MYETTITKQDEFETHHTLHMPILHLVDGYFKTQLLKLVNKVEAPVYIVAVVTPYDWSAYIGHPAQEFFRQDKIEGMMSYIMDDSDTVEWAAKRGDKLPEAEARTYFPNFPDLYYRV